MRFKNTRQWLAAGLAVILLIQAGCGSGLHELEREDLVDPEPAASYVVTTTDGRQETFVSLHLEGEDLVGTVRITTTELVGEGEEQRENVTNRYEERRIPWVQVERVEAKERRKSKGGVLLAVAAIAAAGVAFILLTQDEPDPPVDDGGGKPPPG